MGDQTTHRARKRFGQNFLHDPKIIQQIVEIINPQPDDHIVEIGPGKGAITRLLITKVQQLDVIEIDRDLVDILRQELGEFDHCTIHQNDALQFDFAGLNKSDVRIVGNLPYNISTPLLFHLLNYHSCIQDMTVMLQKELVDRICADTGTKQYGRLSIMLQYYCQTEALLSIKPGAFKPSPKVDSAIVKLTPKKDGLIPLADKKSFELIVRTAFSQRRKTIKNALKNMIDAADLVKIDIAPEMRAENLSIEQFVNIANLYHHL